ncbi:ABC transporter ATP-binding protein [Flavobacterium sp. BFFFF1]|uniref:ABC transporter ATP-binding protein n=1 Tax=Flavobacterium sp. BFFFF1 TaxID=2015557 RepID=UPI0026C50641
MMEQQSLIVTEDLCIGYTNKKQPVAIASAVNITLNKGTLTALVGANGIGKSTLLRTLTGIQQPLSGNITLSGRPLTQFEPLALAKQISVVLTEKLPPGNLTIYEIIALGRQPYTNWLGKMSPEDLDKVNEAITLTGVQELLSKKHYEASDGQLQNAMIARALAQDTPIIILDEPTTHLDLPHKLKLFALLKKLAADKGKCVLFSTHDIDLAAEISDEMIVMSEGKIIQDSPKALIINGTLNRIFAADGIRFDPDKGRFTFDSL